MKTPQRQISLPAILLGSVLLTAGCTTPTVKVGNPTPANSACVTVGGLVPTVVQCVWHQDGARIQHDGTTPFRLVLPSTSIQEIEFTKSAAAAEVTIEIRSSALEPCRFVMERGSSRMRAIRHGCWWEPFKQSS